MLIGVFRTSARSSCKLSNQILYMNHFNRPQEDKSFFPSTIFIQITWWTIR